MKRESAVFASSSLTAAFAHLASRRVNNNSPAQADTMRLVAALGGRPAASFANLAALAAEAGVTGIDPPRARAMRDLFLELPNKHLQSLYRAHFAARESVAGQPHQEKLASLAPLEAEAKAIVERFDWDWLARWIGAEASPRAALSRLSNFAFTIKRVNFRFTYHCNVTCAHCYNESGPRQKSLRLPLDAMLSIVAQMPAAGIRALNLTGGEPFLYPDHLLTLIAAGRDVKLDEISIYTNGFWATTPEAARAMLARLAAAGLMQSQGDHIKVSTGRFHQEFIAFERIGTLARAYRDMFGRRLRVDYEETSSEAIAAARKRIETSGFMDCVQTTYRKTQPLGRGRDLDRGALMQIRLPCRSINQIVYDPDGTARPCCGLNNENSGVVIGQLRDHGLLALVKRMQNDPVLQVLAHKPMSTIFDHVPAERNAAGYAGMCHLCQHAIGDLADKEALQARLFDGQEFFPFWFAPGADAGAAETQMRFPCPTGAL